MGVERQSPATNDCFDNVFFYDILQIVIDCSTERNKNAWKEEDQIEKWKCGMGES